MPDRPGDGADGPLERFAGDLGFYRHVHMTMQQDQRPWMAPADPSLKPGDGWKLEWRRRLGATLDAILLHTALQLDGSGTVTYDTSGLRVALTHRTCLWATPSACDSGLTGEVAAAVVELVWRNCFAAPAVLHAAWELLAQLDASSLPPRKAATVLVDLAHQVMAACPALPWQRVRLSVAECLAAAAAAAAAPQRQEPPSLSAHADDSGGGGARGTLPYDDHDEERGRTCGARRGAAGGGDGGTWLVKVPLARHLLPPLLAHICSEACCRRAALSQDGSRRRSAEPAALRCDPALALFLRWLVRARSGGGGSSGGGGGRARLAAAVDAAVAGALRTAVAGAPLRQLHPMCSALGCGVGADGPSQDSAALAAAELLLWGTASLAHGSSGSGGVAALQQLCSAHFAKLLDAARSGCGGSSAKGGQTGLTAGDGERSLGGLVRGLGAYCGLLCCTGVVSDVRAVPHLRRRRASPGMASVNASCERGRERSASFAAAPQAPDAAQSRLLDVTGLVPAVRRCRYDECCGAALHAARPHALRLCRFFQLRLPHKGTRVHCAHVTPASVISRRHGLEPAVRRGRCGERRKAVLHAARAHALHPCRALPNARASVMRLLSACWPDPCCRCPAPRAAAAYDRWLLECVVDAEAVLSGASHESSRAPHHIAGGTFCSSGGNAAAAAAAPLARAHRALLHAAAVLLTRRAWLHASAGSSSSSGGGSGGFSSASAARAAPPPPQPPQLLAPLAAVLDMAFCAAAPPPLRPPPLRALPRPLARGASHMAALAPRSWAAVRPFVPPPPLLLRGGDGGSGEDTDAADDAGYEEEEEVEPRGFLINLAHLPLDAAALALSYLGHKRLCRLACVSAEWRALTRLQHVWRAAFFTRWQLRCLPTATAADAAVAMAEEEAAAAAGEGDAGGFEGDRGVGGKGAGRRPWLVAWAAPTTDTDWCQLYKRRHAAKRAAHKAMLTAQPRRGRAAAAAKPLVCPLLECCALASNARSLKAHLRTHKNPAAKPKKRKAQQSAGAAAKKKRKATATAVLSSSGSNGSAAVAGSSSAAVN
ncbi:hypothetical protein JKP88DRAFT_318456 [Tribonema minus]|uniref:F-box domain-containing protein n=1 Tax=Tribonema minus TaxID=303371 RepID=A0A835Z014_9STRA|nr:hypothetical protein JKP88DRAFT_318456 [Tribonema minus]